MQFSAAIVRGAWFPLMLLRRSLSYGISGGPLWKSVACCLFAGLMIGSLKAAEGVWPALPETNASVEIPAQEWPFKPGERTVRILIHYPGGQRARVTPDTGLMLTLHNWGGTDCVGTADPATLAERLNVVAICVNYLQSGKQASIDDPEPYDFGYLQGLDALRALWFVFHGLQQADIPFDAQRLFATGGSGGGNVSLMCNKLAPRTLTAVVDMCGMKQLSDDIAYNLPGGSGLNARWSRDPDSPYYLSPDQQQLRDVGWPAHLETMKSLGNSSKVFVVHGMEDTTCPFADAERLVRQFQQAQLDVVPEFIGPERLDGKVFTSAGHALGNRTEIVFQVAGDWLEPTGSRLLRRTGRTDFEHRDAAVRYQTSNGAYVIDYRQGYPIGRFEPTR